MIYQLKGNVIATAEDFAIIDVNGVGYGVFVPARTIGTQLKEGEPVLVHTLTIVSQDDIRLFGFTSTMDRHFFRMLINIPRIGPKGALKILSSSSSVQIMQAILAGDRKALCQIPGIGGKAAQRLIVELQEKVKAILDSGEVEYEDVYEEAVEVLTGLGCAPTEARDVLARVRESEKGRDLPFDDLLNEALKLMSGLDER